MPCTTEKGMPASQSVSSSSPAAKDKGIAAFQPDHATSFLRFAQQDLVDLLLRDAVVARTFADEHPVGIAAHQIHDVIGDQPIIDHHVSLLDLLQAFEREQPGVTGAGANQHHLAAMLQRLRQQLLSGIRDCLPIVISQRLRQTVVNKQLLPEAATLAYGGKLLLNPRAQMAGIAGQLAEM